VSLPQTHTLAEVAASLRVHPRTLCRDCHGTGEVTVFRNVYGEFDFLDGVPTGEFMTCQLCNGEGYEE
jgi:DnaJ-class molecular chaperone